MRNVFLVGIIITLVYIIVTHPVVALQTFDSPPPPPPSCYCENITFLTCYNSDGCMWDEGGWLTWRPWTTFTSPPQYYPPPRRDIYLPIVMR